MPTRKMVNLSVEETSGVDHPAHLMEGWVIMKQANRDAVDATIAELVGNDQNLEGIDMAELVEVQAELAKAIERIVELEAQVAEAQTEVEVVDNSDEALIKSAPVAVREMLEKARAEAQAVREELQKERDGVRDREFVEKAKGWSHLSIDADSFGPSFRQLVDANPDLASIMEKALESANAQAESGHIFDEIGKPASMSEVSGGNAFGRVQSLAKAAVAAGDYPTVEQAVAGLVSKNPNLYADYLAERQS